MFEADTLLVGKRASARDNIFLPKKVVEERGPVAAAVVAVVAVIVVPGTIKGDVTFPYDDPCERLVPEFVPFHFQNDARATFEPKFAFPCCIVVSPMGAEGVEPDAMNGPKEGELWEKIVETARREVDPPVHLVFETIPVCEFVVLSLPLSPLVVIKETETAGDTGGKTQLRYVELETVEVEVEAVVD